MIGISLRLHIFRSVSLISCERRVVLASASDDMVQLVQVLFNEIDFICERIWSSLVLLAALWGECF